MSLGSKPRKRLTFEKRKEEQCPLVNLEANEKQVECSGKLNK
jgi:hypothetical protein